MDAGNVQCRHNWLEQSVFSSNYISRLFTPVCWRTGCVPYCEGRINPWQPAEGCVPGALQHLELLTERWACDQRGRSRAAETAAWSVHTEAVFTLWRCSFTSSFSPVPSAVCVTCCFNRSLRCAETCWFVGTFREEPACVCGIDPASFGSHSERARPERGRCDFWSLWAFCCSLF